MYGWDFKVYLLYFSPLLSMRFCKSSCFSMFSKKAWAFSVVEIFRFFVHLCCRMLCPKRHRRRFSVVFYPKCSSPTWHAMYLLFQLILHNANSLSHMTSLVGRSVCTFLPQRPGPPRLSFLTVLEYALLQLSLRCSLLAGVMEVRPGFAPYIFGHRNSLGPSSYWHSSTL